MVELQIVRSMFVHGCLNFEIRHDYSVNLKNDHNSLLKLMIHAAGFDDKHELSVIIVTIELVLSNTNLGACNGDDSGVGIFAIIDVNAKLI